VGKALILITVEKVPRKLLEPYKDLPRCAGNIPAGITLTNGTMSTSGGFEKVEVLIQEKMSQYKTRLVLAHELFHCLQFLTDCQMDETNNDKIDTVMVKALKEKRHKK
jgi:hypothetical protein